MDFELGPAGEAAMRLVFTGPPQPALTRALLKIENQANQRFGPTLTDSVIGYTTLTLFFSASTLERHRTEAWLIEQAEAITLVDHSEPEDSTADVVLPVLYHPSVAPDLEWLADDRSLGIDDVIALHSNATYFAYATGFAPGFCYLGSLATALQTPRLDTPRATVPVGAVAIADSQTAVYPCASPGGWRLIGACPEPLFNLNSTPPSLLNVGVTVRFEPINEADFRALGGVIP
jgi:KipI family sensor histidine kinase inhibitor